MDHAAKVTEIIDRHVPPAANAGTRPGIRLRQVNVLASSMLTLGDLEHLRDVIEWFGLRPVFVPDVSDSPGYTGADAGSRPAPNGATPSQEFATLGNAVATLVVGPSLTLAAGLLANRTGVRSYRLDHLYGLAATDDLMSTLQHVSGTKTPHRLQRQRAELLAALEDFHFGPGPLHVGIAAEPDQLKALCQFMLEIGGEIAAAVASGDGPALATLPRGDIAFGTLEDVEELSGQNIATMLVGNVDAAERALCLGVPVLRWGFPVNKNVGGAGNTTICYAGARRMLLNLMNLPLASHHPREVSATRAVKGRARPQREEAVETRRA